MAVLESMVVYYFKCLGFGSCSAAHKMALSEINRGRISTWWATRKVSGWLKKVREWYEEYHVASVTKWGKESIVIWGCFWKGCFGLLVLIPIKSGEWLQLHCLFIFHMNVREAIVILTDYGSLAIFLSKWCI